MSNQQEDEEFLLEVMKKSVHGNISAGSIGGTFYPFTSYILRAITLFRLDGWKLEEPDMFTETVVGRTWIDSEITGDLDPLCGYILKQIENASSQEMDDHNAVIFLVKELDKHYFLNTILMAIPTIFAITHGVWLLILKFICLNSDKEDIIIALKRVDDVLINLRGRSTEVKEDGHLHFYMYISLLSSMALKMPRDNWESMSSLYNLINVIFKVISTAYLSLKDVYGYIETPLKDEFEKTILLSTYWVGRGIFACSSQCNHLPKNGYIIQDSQKLTYIYDKLVSLQERLQKLDKDGKQYMDDEKIAKAYDIPNKYDQTKYYALTALFGLQHDTAQDVKFSNCDRTSMGLSEVTAKHRTLVLIVSGSDIPSNVVYFLKNIYAEFIASLEQATCEFIWLPIHAGPWTEYLEDRYRKLSRMMPWYTLDNPTFISEGTKKFITTVWKFHNKPIMVVLNEKGNVVCPNAIHMMYIWGSKAFPLTRMRERTLWKNETSLKSIVLDFDSSVINMLKASKWVMLYGGNDLEWVRKFITSIIHGISVDDSGISIEMIYVGRNIENEKVREMISLEFGNSSQSNTLDAKKIWYFWIRLESILISKYQLFSARDCANDPLIGEVKRLLRYASTENWACLITPSSDTMIHDYGDTMLEGLMEYESWKQHIHTTNFTQIFKNHIEQLRLSQMSGDQCSRIVLDTDNKDIVKSLECPDCNYIMEKKMQYRCCHVEDDLE